MSVIESAKKKYAQPAFTRIACDQVLLDLIERAKHDEQLAAHLRESIHQGDPEYSED